jgi:hypothetical protein
MMKCMIQLEGRMETGGEFKYEGTGDIGVK